MKTPEIILIVLWSIGLLYNAYMHGKEKEGTYNVFASLIAVGVYLSLLMWAGLFRG